LTHSRRAVLRFADAAAFMADDVHKLRNNCISLPLAIARTDAQTSTDFDAIVPSTFTPSRMGKSLF